MSDPSVRPDPDQPDERGRPDRTADAPDRSADAPVAYVMSRFPKLTETFILFEIREVERLGQRVELYPLLRHHETVSHPEALPLVARAHYQSFLSWAIVRSNLAMLRRRPRAYLGALAALVRGTLGSANYLVGGLAIFPKVVHMANEMEATGIRHIHCHFSNHPAAAGFVIHRLTGIPFSFVAHGSDLHVDRHMLDRKVAEAAFAIAISVDNLAEMIQACGPWAADRIAVVHCGVDTAALRPPAAPRDPTRPFTILCIGTLHEVKGQGVLIDACARLRAAGVTVTCRFIGDGPDESALQARIDAAGLADSVTLDGRRTRAEVIDALAGADLLVAPSVVASDGKREGIPVVLMEAMSTGLPVVASRLSGIPELVDDEVSGILVPPGDAAALATAIGRLVADTSLRERMGVAARARVLRDFDLTTNALAILERIDRSAPPTRSLAAAAGSIGVVGADRSPGGRVTTTSIGDHP